MREIRMYSTVLYREGWDRVRYSTLQVFQIYTWATLATTSFRRRSQL